MARPLPSRTTSPRDERWKLAIPIALALALLTWVFWPNPYNNVKNLASRGTAIVAFGDSLTVGYGAASGEDYPSRVAAAIGTPVINAGVSGDTTDSALPRIEDDVLARDPRIVIVGLGGNDFLRNTPLPATEANLRTIVRKLQGGGAMVVLLGFRFPSLGSNYEAMYERVADEEGCLIVEDLLDGILSDPALRRDPIHPNAKGYAVMAERVTEPLRGLIEAANETR